MRTLAVFARWPERGTSKTRLAGSLTAGLALELHRAMLADALATAAATPADRRVVWWADPPAGHDTQLPAGFEARVQQGSDLGERLAGAFATLAHDGADRMIAIGVDCPALGPDTIARAFAELDRAGVVLGPARDGGYYLIGLTKPASALFRDIEWGGPAVLARTLERAEEARLRPTLLEWLEDLDTAEDLVREIAALARGARASSHLAETLRTLGLLPPTGATSPRPGAAAASGRSSPGGASSPR